MSELVQYFRGPGGELITTSGNLTFSTTSLDNGYNNGAYDEEIVVIGGVEPYVLTLTDGALPTGLAIVTTHITGTPTVPGTYNFEITATDAEARTAAYNFSIEIEAELSILTVSLPYAVVGEYYEEAVTAAGGTEPRLFYAVDPMPDGLTLDTDGTIYGVPTTASTDAITFRVIDADALQADKDL